LRSGDSAADGRRRPGAGRLTIAFVLARRFTLTPFALFVDMLRLTGDEGDRSRRVRCDWHILGEKRPADRRQLRRARAADGVIRYDHPV
jgi:transcriptional regulator GlxA family with amidase domain